MPRSVANPASLPSESSAPPEPPPVRPARRVFLSLLPAILLAVLTFWAGTFDGAATAVGAATTSLVVLAAAACAGRHWTDPLALGRRGRWLLAALWVVVLAGCWASPVSRAGWVVALTLPAWLLLPAAVARAWGRGAARKPAEPSATEPAGEPGEAGEAEERGEPEKPGLSGDQGGLKEPASAGPGRPIPLPWPPRTVAVLLLALAGTALAGRFFLGDARAAAPLGHHNLVAVWLLALLPLAALALRDRGAWRLLGAVGVAAGLAALAATGSLSGALGLVALVLLAALLVSRWTEWDEGSDGSDAGARLHLPDLRSRLRHGLPPLLAGLALVALTVALPRLGSIVAGTDPSTAARHTYWTAGLRGVAESPWLGHGAGSVPWTISLWHQPRPGVNPPSEVIGDLHSLPLHLLFELGGTGLALVLAVGLLFVRRRLAALPGAADPALSAAGLLGLAGAGVATLGVAPLAVPAVPAALALAAGAVLAGEGSRPAVGVGGGAAPPALSWVPAVYALAAAATLAPLLLAQLHYDRSIGADGEAARRELAAAVRFDPRFPLYRAQRARSGDEADAAGALRAAEAAPGVAALWLSAGELAVAVDAPWAGRTLERACRLDPLGAAAPFLLARLAPADPEAPRRVARALLAEPRLAAALFFEPRRRLLVEGLGTVAARAGVEAGWRESLVQSVVEWEPGESGELAELRFGAAGHRGSLALHAFRRRPRVLDVAAVPVRRALAEQIRVPPASRLPSTSPDAFDAAGCRAPGGG